MYPDVITPKSYPELLSAVDYDPFGVMPKTFPAHPRVLYSAANLTATRRRLEEGSPHDHQCLERLRRFCDIETPLPTPEPPKGALVALVRIAAYSALIWQITGETRYKQHSLDAVRRAAALHHKFKEKWSGGQHNEAAYTATAYDLLMTEYLAPDDDAAIRELLEAYVCALDRQAHHHCNNHNGMQMYGRIAAAAALGNMQYVHDALYGTARSGTWRYGLIHLLRHDFLHDGMQWEGTLSYHSMVLLHACECLVVMEQLGVNLWHRMWPSLRQSDGYDEHRGWGAKAEKPLMAAFDALLYSMTANGDYSQVHDQGLGNLRGTVVWWPFFHKAYTEFGEPRYAWALRHINNGKALSPADPSPPWLLGSKASGNIALPYFIRFAPLDIPAGEHPLKSDRHFAAQGEHVAGCSNFAMNGVTILRCGATSTRAPAAILYWGPHWSGHRSPAALHLDIHTMGHFLADAPFHFGEAYADERHRSWLRTTIAHNTVTLDEHEMFPYDFASTSLWECDIWRDSISDGQLLNFQPGKAFSCVRVRNENVYSGALLDRTVVLTKKYLLDVFRVVAADERKIDWAAHINATLTGLADGTPLELGSANGYRHLRNARLHPQVGEWAQLSYQQNGVRGDARHLSLWLSQQSGVRLISADDPEPQEKVMMGAKVARRASKALILRATAREALFVAVWSLGKEVCQGVAVAGTAGGDVGVTLEVRGRKIAWSLPSAGKIRRA